MPLHDWDELTGWDGVRHFWITNLFHWIRPRLPPEYRAYVGSVPTLGVTGESERPDVAVRHWLREPSVGGTDAPASADEAVLEEPVQTSISVDLEDTYRRAASDAYLT